MRWYAFLFILNGFRYHRYINPLIFVAVLSRQVWQVSQSRYPLTTYGSLDLVLSGIWQLDRWLLSEIWQLKVIFYPKYGSLSTGSLLIEVGSSGNSLMQAIRTMEMLAQAVLSLAHGSQ